VNVAICRYGAGNVRSVELAFRRLGAEIVEDVYGADLAVLPGVGDDAALRGRCADGKPVLGICLGLQLALDFTEEDGGVEGLGLLPGRAVRLDVGRVPRLGWAEVTPLVSAFYFAHSYACETPAATAWSEGIVAEARAGSFLGVQFHPEKSGAAGVRYLERVLDEVRCPSLV
jgi:imidazole glycerol phosphate synthase glutamine amidotransferase subunit